MKLTFTGTCSTCPAASSPPQAAWTRRHGARRSTAARLTKSRACTSGFLCGRGTAFAFSPCRPSTAGAPHCRVPSCCAVASTVGRSDFHSRAKSTYFGSVSAGGARRTVHPRPLVSRRSPLTFVCGQAAVFVALRLPCSPSARRTFWFASAAQIAASSPACAL